MGRLLQFPNRPKSANELKQEFAKRVTEDPDYCVWVLLSLYDSQTKGEKRTRITSELNGKGFTAANDVVLSKLAEKVLTGKPLTASDHQTLKNVLPKYWRQFLTLREPPPQPKAAGLRTAKPSTDQEAA